jgi:hypothetical protein
MTRKCCYLADLQTNLFLFVYEFTVYLITLSWLGLYRVTRLDGQCMMNSQSCGKNQSDVLSRYLHGSTDRSGRAVYGVRLWPLAFWDCGLESHREHV